jgi:hypothetical protein
MLQRASISTVGEEKMGTTFSIMVRIRISYYQPGRESGSLMLAPMLL